MKSINYFKAEVSTERQNGKYLRLGQTGNTNKSPLHFLCRTQCGIMGPCCTKRSHAHGTKTPCWRANNAVWPWKERILLLEEVIYTCQLFLRHKREIFILGVLGFLKTTRSLPKVPEELRSLQKTSEVCRRRPKSAEGEVIEVISVPVLGRV